MANDLITRLLLETGAFDSNLKNATNEVKNFQRNAQAVGSKFSSGLGVLSKFAPQLAAIGGGFAAFNATINSSQKMQDGFNSVMAQGTEVVSSFFTHLTTGNFSTFISGLQGVIDKAKLAYEALDDLESFSVRATPEMNILDSEMQDSLEKARIARISGDKKTYEEQLKLARGYYADYEKLAQSEADKKLNSARTYLNKELSKFEVGMTDDELKYYFSGSNYNEVNKLANRYGEYLELVKQYNKLNGIEAEDDTTQQWVDSQLADIKSKMAVFEQNALVMNQMKKAYAATQIDDGKEEFKQAMENLRAVESQTIALERKGNMIDKVAAKEVTANNKIAASKGDKETSSLSYKPTSAGVLEYGSIAYYESQLSKWKEVYRNAGEEKARTEAKAYMDKYQEILDGFNPKAKLTDTDDKSKELNQDLAAMSTIVSSLGSAFSSSGDDGVQAFTNLLNSCVPLISAVMTLALAEGEAKVAETSQHWAEIIAGSVAVAAALASTFATYKNAGQYATGGIVPGSSYSGDHMLAQVNSGEMILNRNQQANLFNLLDGKGSVGTNQVEFKLRGQELIGLIKNTSNRNSKLL